MAAVRKSLLGLVGAIAILVGIGYAALSLHSTSAQVGAGFRCSGPFEASIYDANTILQTSAVGRATLEVNQQGSVNGRLELQDGSQANLFGQVYGRSVSLLLELSDGTQVYGVGTARNDVNDCRGRMGGPAVIERAGVTGLWTFVGETKE